MELLADRVLIESVLDQLEQYYLETVILREILNQCESLAPDALIGWRERLEAMKSDEGEFRTTARQVFAEQRRKVLASLDLSQALRSRGDNLPEKES